MPTPTLIDGWPLFVGGGAGVLLGAAVLLWALLSDRSRGRRRCPRCFYSMEGLRGLKCPECGHSAGRERELFRTRRRWRWAGVAAVALAAGSGVALHGYVRTIPGHWWRVLPTSIVLFFFDKEFAEGARETVFQRVLAERNRVSPTYLASADVLSDRNWWRLAEACRDAIIEGNVTTSTYLFGSEILDRIPNAELADEVIVELLSHDDCGVRLAGSFAACRYYMFRGELGTWIDLLVQNAVEPTCPTAAEAVVDCLIRAGPHYHEILKHIIGRYQTDNHPELARAWSLIERAFTSPLYRIPADERLAFIESLEASDDSALRGAGARLRAALEAAAGKDRGDRGG